MKNLQSNILEKEFSSRRAYASNIRRESVFPDIRKTRRWDHHLETEETGKEATTKTKIRTPDFLTLSPVSDLHHSASALSRWKNIASTRDFEATFLKRLASSPLLWGQLPAHNIMKASFQPIT